MLIWRTWYTLALTEFAGGLMKKVNLKKARDLFSQIIHEAAYLHERYTICKANRPMVVMISYDDWNVIEAMYREIDEKRKLKE